MSRGEPDAIGHDVRLDASIIGRSPAAETRHRSGGHGSQTTGDCIICRADCHDVLGDTLGGNRVEPPVVKSVVERTGCSIVRGCLPAAVQEVISCSSGRCSIVAIVPGRLEDQVVLRAESQAVPRRGTRIVSSELVVLPLAARTPIMWPLIAGPVTGRPTVDRTVGMIGQVNSRGLAGR